MNRKIYVKSKHEFWSGIAYYTLSCIPDSPDVKLDPWHGGEPWRGRIAISCGWLVTAGVGFVHYKAKLGSRFPTAQRPAPLGTPGTPGKVYPNPTKKIQGYSLFPGPWKVPQLPLGERQCEEWIPTSQAKPFRIALPYLTAGVCLIWAWLPYALALHKKLTTLS